MEGHGVWITLTLTTSSKLSMAQHILAYNNTGGKGRYNWCVVMKWRIVQGVMAWYLVLIAQWLYEIELNR